MNPTNQEEPMTNVLLRNGQPETLETIVLDNNVDSYGIPRRSYDYDKGDRRFLDQWRAIEHANEEARRTGVRQVVRPDLAEVPGAKGRFYLVQAVGS
jgi:hypothetical protein